MCGIVGYIGHRSAADVVVDGLTRLEYRGYDSAGIVTADKQAHLEVVKRAGKLSILKDALKTVSKFLSTAISYFSGSPF